MSDWPDDREALRAAAGLHSNFTSAPNGDEDRELWLSLVRELAAWDDSAESTQDFASRLVSLFKARK